MRRASLPSDSTKGLDVEGKTLALNGVQSDAGICGHQRILQRPRFQRNRGCAADRLMARRGEATNAETPRKLWAAKHGTKWKLQFVLQPKLNLIR